jgi:hypothetical protein
MENLRLNNFSELYIESDDELFEQNKRINVLQKLEKNFNNAKIKEEKRRLKYLERKKQEDEEYALSLKRTKVRDNLMVIKFIKEDNYNIASYLSLSREIISSLNINIYSCALVYGGFTIFDKNEYLYLVEIMEKAKNIYYYDPIKQMKDIMSISEERMMKCYFSGINKRMGYEFAGIYHIYKLLLWDTPNYRRFLKDSNYKRFKEIIDEDLLDFIENTDRTYSEIEREYVCKYFELGKRYYAKRNNFKILFKKYVKFIGKLMIIKNNL